MNKLPAAALRQIVKEEGVGAFRDPFRFWAMFEDMAGRHDTEGVILLYLVNNNLLTELDKAYTTSSETTKHKTIQALEERLIREAGFSKADVFRFLSCVCSAFGWSVPLISRPDQTAKPESKPERTMIADAKLPEKTRTKTESNADFSAQYTVPHEATPAVPGGSMATGKKKKGGIRILVAIAVILAVFLVPRLLNGGLFSRGGDQELTESVVADAESDQEDRMPPERILNQIAVEASDLEIYPDEHEYEESGLTGMVDESVELRLRLGPGTSYESIGYLPAGILVPVFAQRGGWALVKYDQTFGWCSSDYLSFIDGKAKYASSLAELDGGMTLMRSGTVETIDYLLGLNENWEYCEGVEYKGAYLLTKQNQNGKDDFNRVGIIYQLTIYIDSDGNNIHRYVTYFFVQEYHNLMVKDDGTVLVDIEDYSNAIGDVFYISEGIYHYSGYPEMSDLLDVWVDPYSDRYDVEYTYGLFS